MVEGTDASPLLRGLRRMVAWFGAIPIAGASAIVLVAPVAQALLRLSFRLDLPIYRRYNPRT